MSLFSFWLGGLGEGQAFFDARRFWGRGLKGVFDLCLEDGTTLVCFLWSLITHNDCSSTQYPIDSIQDGINHCLPIIPEIRTTDKLAFLGSPRWTAPCLGREHLTGQLYQNLAAAKFPSPTGACKPFDAAADGGCCGEGMAKVIHKPQASPVEENDSILGVITGSAVNQNRTLNHLTVPHSESQVPSTTK